MAACAGYGGLELGLRGCLRETRVVCCVEREAYAAALLAARMEAGDVDPAPIWSDANTFDGKPWRGVVDLFAAGFPCQPHSVAGKHLGTQDERWIWPELARIIREVQPGIVALENVPGLVATHGLAECLGDLAEAGLDAEWGCLRASAIGAPHRRERLFILAADARGKRLWLDEQRAARGWVDLQNSGDAVAVDDGSPWASAHADGGRLQERRRVPGDLAEEFTPTVRGSLWWQRYAAPPAVIRIVDDGDLAALDLSGAINGIVQTLQLLRSDVLAEVLQERCTDRGQVGTAEVLQPLMRKQQARVDPGWLSGKGEEILRVVLRKLRRRSQAVDTSQEQRLERQSSVEFDDAVRLLSHVIASCAGGYRAATKESAVCCLRQAVKGAPALPEAFAAEAQVWRSGSYEDQCRWLLCACQKAITAHRVDRLRCLGNGVVPPQAAEAYYQLGQRLLRQGDQ